MTCNNLLASCRIDELYGHLGAFLNELVEKVKETWVTFKAKDKLLQSSIKDKTDPNPANSQSLQQLLHDYSSGLKMTKAGSQDAGKSPAPTNGTLTQSIPQPDPIIGTLPHGFSA
jgi:hypothetical protein